MQVRYYVLAILCSKFHAFVFVEHPSIIDFVSPLVPMGLCVNADLIFDVFLVLPLVPMVLCLNSHLILGVFLALVPMRLCLNSDLILGVFLTLIREHSFSSLSNNFIQI